MSDQADLAPPLVNSCMHETPPCRSATFPLVADVLGWSSADRNTSWALRARHPGTCRAGLLGAAGLVVLIGTVGFLWDLRRRRRAAVARNGGNVRDLIPAAPSGVWRGAQTDKPQGVCDGWP